MALSPGTRIGSFEITAQIGVGGMGEVYRATDTNLKRQVAIKVLPEAVATDAERLARFRREAEVLAALNHSNIAQIHGLETSGGTTALVMELVEGPTLADRIAQGTIPVDEALAIARQVAEALEAAHEQGIVHRDLKPANVKVTPAGTVKVLDFGLAKAMDPTAPGASTAQALSMSPTITTPAMTQAGVILGTAAYMSPEQASGQPIDKRSDIWSFGVVLFEMLTGRQLFAGETVSHVLAAVLREQPPLDELPGGTPAPVRRLLRRCLAKKRTDRLPDIAMARLEIDEALSGPVPADAARDQPHDRPGARLPLILGSAVGGAVVAGLIVWLAVAGGAEGSREVTHFTVPVDAGHEMLYAEAPELALSPDGRTLAYVSDDSLYVKHFDRADDAVRLEGTTGANSPFFSPDGQSIGFVLGGRIRRISIDGPPVIDITPPEELVGDYVGAHWTADGTIVYAGQSSREIWQVPAAGGPSSRLTAHGDALQPYRKWPQMLDAGHVLYTRLRTGHSEDADVVVYDLESGVETVVVERGIYGRYVPSGHVLYATGTGTVMAVPFDLASATTTGDPYPVQSNVRIAHWGGGASFAVSDSGTAAFVHGSNLERRRVWWTDRMGRRIRELGSPTYVLFMNLSPDGRRLAMDVSRPQGTGIWLADAVTGERERLTLDDAYVFSPVWSPDGTQFAYLSYGQGREVANYRILTQAVDGGVPSVVSEAEPGELLWLTSWSPDGRWLAISTATARTGASDLYVLDLQDGQERTPVAVTTANEFFGQFSPDGRWLAYQSNAGGQDDVFVVSFPDLSDRRQLSIGGGMRPRWSAAGDEIFYWTPGKALVARKVSTEGRLTWQEPRVLFEAPDVEESPTYTVSPDGQSFQIVVVNEDSLAREIHVATNWLEELRRLAPSN